MLSSPVVRLIAALLVLAAAIVFGLGGQWVPMTIALIVGGILIFMHFRLGPVFLALQHLYKGNIAKTEGYLGKVKDPEKLAASHRAYYHFCKGYITMQQNKRDEAREHFRKALDNGLRLGNDKAVAHVSLAQIYVQEHNKKEAERHLERAKSYKHNEAVTQAIEEVSKQLRI